MRSIKAVIAGSLFIVIVNLFIQLTYIFLAVAYHSLAKDYPGITGIGDVVRYLVGIPVLMLTMFFGGYITAYIVRIRVLLHCFIVGLLVVGWMLMLSPDYADITLTGVAVLVISLATTMAGGFYWKRDK